MKFIRARERFNVNTLVKFIWENFVVNHPHHQLQDHKLPQLSDPTSNKLQIYSSNFSVKLAVFIRSVLQLIDGEFALGTEHPESRPYTCINRATERSNLIFATSNTTFSLQNLINF